MPAGRIRRLISKLRTEDQEPAVPQAIGVEESRLGSLPLLYLTGELDHHSAGQLRSTIQALLDREPGEVEPDPPPEVPQPFPQGLLLDLGGLEYLDSGGLALLFDLARAFEQAGRGDRLGILNPTPQVSRLLQISGLNQTPGITVVEDARATKRGRASSEEVGPGPAEEGGPGS